MPLLVLALAGSAVAADSPSIRSVYTDISVFDWEHGCEVVRKTKVEGKYLKSAVWRCRGYGSAPLFVRYEDDPTGGRGYDIDAGFVDVRPVSTDKSEDQPTTVEWRISQRRPFAVIYRRTILLDQFGKPNPSALIVKTVGKPGKPGCPIANVNALKPNANLAARKAADAVLAGKARCISLRD